MNKNFCRCFVFSLIILLFTAEIFSQKTLDLRKPLNPENFKIWDEYIRQYAPSDDAYNVVIHIARQHYFTGNYITALEVFNIYETLFPNKKDEIQNEKSNLIALSLIQSPNERNYQLYEQLAFKLAGTEDGFVAVQRLSEKYIKKRQFDSAVAVFEKYKPIYKNLQWKFDEVTSILTRPEDSVSVHNLGANVNSKWDEWDPNPTPDGHYLFFSSSIRPGGFGDQDVWYCESADTSWQKPKNLGKQINSSNAETIDNVSFDGNTLLLSGTFAGTFGKFDIYSATRTENGWGNLYHFPMPINSINHDEAAFLTSDGKALIFTSDRPGGIGDFIENGRGYHGGVNGNMDIYVCLKTDSGWSAPINLGNTINTPYSERSPSLSADGKTLYFGSDGHPGLGRLDVFKSTRLEDTSWTDWCEPENLGRFINSTEDDWGYKFGITGDSAFFASKNREGGFGGWDLYSITIPAIYKPQKVVIIKGKILDQNDNPLSASIKWEDLSSGKLLGELHSNPKTGEYIIALPFGFNYGYFVQKENYYPTSGNIDLREKTKDSIIYKNIKLISTPGILQQGEKITINNIFFDFDDYSLKKESYLELNRLLDYLKTIEFSKIIVEGHTDDIGDEAYNLQLSRNRAKSVADYLISKGISKLKIQIEGYGSSKPIFPNTNEENRKQNRRVEISVRE
ncbi:MAG TPA: hypothetical protein DCW42_00750 [Bacteroidetes bacterium]|nr:hypothetical protein [Bacteroidota bacterium]